MIVTQKVDIVVLSHSEFNLMQLYLIFLMIGIWYNRLIKNLPPSAELQSANKLVKPVSVNSPFSDELF
jgi:hypothetical protein